MASESLIRPYLDAARTLTAPPLPLDFKLKCLELAIRTSKNDSLEYHSSHYTNLADDFYDWLTAKGSDT